MKEPVGADLNGREDARAALLELAGGALALVGLLFVGPWIHEATWPIWLILVGAGVAWGYCLGNDWLRSAANAVLLPAVAGLALLFVALIAFNLIGARLGEVHLRAAEELLLQAHLWFRRLAQPNLSLLVGILVVGLVVVRWRTLRVGSGLGTRTVSRILAVRTALGTVATFLLTLSSFTLFSALPLDGWAEADHEARVGEWEAGQHRLQVLEREERTAVARYLAVQVIGQAVARAEEEDLSVLARSIAALDKDVEASLQGYPGDFQVEMHNWRIHRANLDAAMAAYDGVSPSSQRGLTGRLFPVATADALRRSQWASAVERGWWDPVKGALEGVLAAVGKAPPPRGDTRDELRRAFREIRAWRARQKRIALGRAPRSLDERREHERRVEELVQRLAEETRRIEGVETRTAEAKEALKATLLAGFTGALPLPESVVGRFVEALVETAAAPIAERWAAEGVERAGRLEGVEAAVEKRAAETARLERLILPAALLRSPSDFRTSLRTPLLGQDGRVRPLAEGFTRSRSRVLEVDRRLEPVRAKQRSSTRGGTAKGRGRP